MRHENNDATMTGLIWNSRLCFGWVRKGDNDWKSMCTERSRF